MRLSLRFDIRVASLPCNPLCGESPPRKSWLFFSATMPQPIVVLSRELLSSPAMVNVERKAAPAEGRFASPTSKISHSRYSDPTFSSGLPNSKRNVPPGASDPERHSTASFGDQPVRVKSKKAVTGTKQAE